jgi:hypothetical protein
MVTLAQLAKDPHFSAVRPNDVHQDANERALAGAIRSEEPEDFARGDVKAYAAERDRTTVTLCEISEREDDHCQ